MQSFAWRPSWLLYSLVTYQRLFSFVLSLKGVLFMVMRQYISLHLMVWALMWPYIIGLTYIELNVFKPKSLFGFHAASQVLKCIILTHDIIRLRFNLLFYHDLRWSVHWWVDVGYLILVLSHYAGLLHIGLNWYRFRTTRRSINSQAAGSDVDLVIRYPQSAHSLKSEGNETFRVISWIFASTFPEVTGKSSTFFATINNVLVAVKFIPGVLALVFTVGRSRRMAGEPQRDGILPNSKFQDWNYEKPASSTSQPYRDRESQRETNGPGHEYIRIPDDEESALSRGADTMSLHSIPEPANERPHDVPISRTDDTSPRLLLPRYLCFLDESEPRGYRVQKLADREAEREKTPNYVFISYTRRQFYTQIAGDPSLPSGENVVLTQAAERDTRALTQLAIAATRRAGIEAFWIDFECVVPEVDETAEDSMEDVYRICDIIRASHSMAIMLGPSLQKDMSHDGESTKSQWLHDWGRRLWTVPEALLCPSEHRIALYTSGAESEPELLAKRNLASRVWDDAGILRQLMDHYESTIHLTQLELITIALECLQRRQTEKHMSGDVTYALTGLLRQRPRVNRKDTDFQAFARLSLANDSDMLLERLLCLQPSQADAPWHDMNDAWGAKLWSINPCVRVADVVDGWTVTVGGAPGALINWDYLEPVDFTTARSLTPHWWYARQGALVARGGLYFTYTYLCLWVAWTTNGVSHSSVAMATVLSSLGITGLGILIAVACPILLRTIYRSEIKSSQARFFGVEGRPHLGEVERLVFGWDTGRLKWASVGNPHHGPEPKVDGEQTREFTLIDTFTMRAVPFRAAEPPSVVLAFGRERGLVRALLCSYDWQRQAFLKETVVRMEAVVLDRMSKMDTVRFTVRRPGAAAV